MQELNPANTHEYEYAFTHYRVILKEIYLMMVCVTLKYLFNLQIVKDRRSRGEIINNSLFSILSLVCIMTRTPLLFNCKYC